MRVDTTFLYERDRLSLIEWLAALWAGYRDKMPGLIAERDTEVAAMTDDELEAAGPWLLGERPDLDVDLVFPLGAVRHLCGAGIRWVKIARGEPRVPCQKS